MHRGFETSTRRRQRTLDGRWEFVTDPGDDGVDARYAESFPSDDADRLAVPCSWNARMEYADYVGPAWYRRTFDLPEATGILLRFAGIGGAATVYLDGEELASTDDGERGVDGFRPELDAGEHELVVRVDNRPDERALGDVDGGVRGGIHREVVLEELPGVYVSDLEIESELEDGDALVETEVTLHNLGHLTKNRRLSVRVGDEEATGVVPVDGRDASKLTLPVLLEDVDHWTPEDPALYDVVVRVDPMVEDPEDPVDGVASVDDPTADEDYSTADEDSPTADEEDAAGDEDDGHSGGWSAAEVGDPNAEPEDPDAAGDELRDRVGLREIAVDGREILLNGEPVELAAVNREEYHPDWGTAQPVRVQQHDLDVLRAAGVDAVRCPDVVHQRFLDLCDEAGILMIEGFGVRGVEPSDLNESSVGDDARQRLVEVVKRDRHHPSVIAWSLAEEWATHEQPVRDAVGDLKAMASGLDDTRLLTLSSTADWGEERDRAFELCDVLSVADDRAGGGGHDADDWSETLDRTANRYGEKPIVVSSFAGAPKSGEGDDGAGSDGSGGADGDRTGSADEWSESVQADRIEELIDEFGDDPAVAGFAVWQFCDTPADVSGIVSAYRQPKEAFGRLAGVLDADD